MNKLSTDKPANKESTRKDQNNMGRKEFAPSSSMFDRSKLSNEEYIERLIFENRELQGTVEKQNRVIDMLQGQLKANDIPLLSATTTSILSGEMPDTPSHSDTLSTADIPQRSAKRQVTPLKVPNQPQPELLTPVRQGSTSPSPNNLPTSPLAVKTPDYESNRSSVYSDLEDDEMEKHKKNNENDQNDATYNDNNQVKTVMSNASNADISSSTLRENEDTEATLHKASEHSKVKLVEVKGDPKEKTSNDKQLSNTDTTSINPSVNKQITETKLQPKAMVSVADADTETKVKEDQSMDLKSKYLTNADNSDDTTNSLIKNDSSTTNLQNNNDLSRNSEIVTQHKNSSTGSFSSNYRSRIKLPPTLKQQAPPQHTNKDLSIDTSTETLASGNIPLAKIDTEKRRPSNEQNSVHSSILSPLNTETSSSQGTNQISNSDYPGFRKSIPLTPEFGLNSGKFSQSQTHLQQSQTSSMTPESNLLKTPNTNDILQHDSGSLSKVSTPNPSFQVLQTPRAEDDDNNLFIKPDDFQTISITVVSTINIQSPASVSPLKRSDEPVCTISVNDRESKKEMWRIRKTYTQLIAFDNEIRPIVEIFGLPQIPDKSLFLSTSPNKIDARRNTLQNYFNTIFLMPHIPHMVLYRICRYLSLDFVNPLDDFRSGARKEGFLVRRYKGLGSSWKIRWCQVDGPYLEIYEVPGGQCVEQIKLKGAQIGRQTNDSVAEERGYRHAFLVLEPPKKISTSSSKHFFCAETDEERDDWVEALIEFNDVGDTSMISNGSTDNDNSMTMEDTDGRYKDSPEEDYSKSVLAHTPTSQTGFLGNYKNHNSTSSVDLNPKGNGQDKMSQKELKEARKLKKRSIFPFRSKLNSLIFDNSPIDNDTSQVTQRSSSQQQPNSPATQQNQQESTIQLYLDDMNLDDNLAKAIFGRELEVAYNLSNHILFERSVPSICFRCLDFLMKTGAIHEEGIFRLSGSASSIRQLKDQFNHEFDLNLFESPLQPDMHTISGLLKSYLRELPTPILGSSYNDLKHITDSRGESSSKSALAIIFRDYLSNSMNIDDIHYNVCYVIFKFLNKIIENNSRNRMNLRNVCIVFVPTLNISLEVLSTLLVDFNCIFEGGQPIADDKREVLDLYIPKF